MNACDGCGLELSPGAAHVNESSCITALRAELDRVRHCAGCGKVVKVGICPPCATKALARGTLARGAGALGQALWTWVTAPPGESVSDGGDGIRQDPDGRKRYVP